MSLVLRLNPIKKTTQNKVYKDLACFDIDDKLTSTDYESITHRISNLFSWTIGGRILEPEFGNFIEYIKYEPLNEITMKNAEAGIRKMLAYEPEISITDIVLTPNEDQNELHIRVDYNIPKLSIKTSTDLTVQIVDK